MASRQAPSSAQRKPRASKQRHQGKRPQGIAKAKPQVRRSTRISRRQKSIEDKKPEQKYSSFKIEQNRPLLLPLKSRKRAREIKSPANNVFTEQPPKRLRSSLAGPCREQALDQEAVSGLSASQKSYIGHWAERKTWPKEYLQHNSRNPVLLPPATPSDQRPREEKSAPYRNPSYPTLLETLGDSYMDESELGITDASKVLYQNLLETECTTPKDTLFRHDAFPSACRNLRDKNEARIIQDIGRLLVPSPETLAALGAKDLGVLVESVNEGWNNSIPVTNTRPQPDFSVGFGRSMFSDDQLSKLQPLLGDPSCLSYFRATYYMYFPVLTCEVKCGITGLDIADRQNAHSMTLTVRGIVELFKLAKKENTLHRELLAFSISHDHRTVRLYGYYPVIDGPKIKIYRHPIHTFDITARDGQERWRTYNFTVGVYSYSLALLKRICSVIDELPSDFNLRFAQPSEPQVSESSGLSQQFEDQILAENHRQSTKPS